MVSITNFGQTGPYRDYELTDLTAQALGGLMNEIGEPDNVPLKLGGYQALYSAGVAGFSAAMIGNPNGFSGVDGIFRFRPDGTAERGLAILEVRREGFRVISPAPDDFREVSR